MDAQAGALAQYSAFTAARLHFSRLFFQTVAFVLAMVAVAAIAFRDLAEPWRSWLFLAVGLALVQAAFITHRLQHQERGFERLLGTLEEGFPAGLRQPASGRFGAKTTVVASLLLLGVALALVGVGRLIG